MQSRIPHLYQNSLVNLLLNVNFHNHMRLLQKMAYLSKNINEMYKKLITTISEKAQSLGMIERPNAPKNTHELWFDQQYTVKKFKLKPISNECKKYSFPIETVAEYSRSKYLYKSLIHEKNQAFIMKKSKISYKQLTQKRSEKPSRASEGKTIKKTLYPNVCTYMGGIPPQSPVICEAKNVIIAS